MRQTHVYDSENRQAVFCTQDPDARVDSPGSGRTLYTFDVDGRRVQDSGPNGITKYVYDDQGYLAVKHSTAPLARPTQYPTAEYLGSTRGSTVSTDAAVVERRDYRPGGGEIFAGKERDAETGLDYFGYRYFSGAQGRWTSPDEPFADKHPEDPQSWNMYAYVRNNPLAHIDPNGKACSALNNSSGFCQRADLYTNLDLLVGSKTRFFAAASAVSQELADVAVPGFGARAASPGTRAFLESTGQALEKLNLESAGQILSGQMTGSEEALDRSMVHKEQTEVQKQLDQFKGANSEGYGTAVKEINALLNGTGAKTQGLVLGGNLLFSTDKAYSTFWAESERALVTTSILQIRRIAKRSETHWSNTSEMVDVMSRGTR
jgi:RHS repeat-associated protein